MCCYSKAAIQKLSLLKSRSHGVCIGALTMSRQLRLPLSPAPLLAFIPKIKASALQHKLFVLKYHPLLQVSCTKDIQGIPLLYLLFTFLCQRALNEKKNQTPNPKNKQSKSPEYYCKHAEVSLHKSQEIWIHLYLITFICLPIPPNLGFQSQNSTQL